MAQLPCPHCKEPSISWWQKYKAAKWALIHCNQCKGRACSLPYPLVFYTMLYIWNVMLFGYLSYVTGNLWYLFTLIVVWVILDLFSIYLPLSALKTKQSSQKN